MYIPPTPPYLPIRPDRTLSERHHTLARDYVRRLCNEVRSIGWLSDMDASPAVIEINRFVNGLPVKNKESILKDIVVGNL